MQSKAIKVFIAYARKDKPYLDELRTHLRVLKRNGTIQKIWYDGEIVAGEVWEEVIQQALQEADLFLMLLSADFINSEYCYGTEMTAALERHHQGEATVIPIVVRDCNWEMTPLGDLQAPVGGKAIANNPAQKDTLYKGIVKAVAEAANKKRQAKQQLQDYFEEKRAWEEALRLDSVVAYQKYLKWYPSGSFASLAKAHLAEKEKVAKRKQQTIKEQIRREAANKLSPKYKKNKIDSSILRKALLGLGTLLAVFMLAWGMGFLSPDTTSETALTENEKDQVLEEKPSTGTSTFKVPEMVFVQGGTFTMGCLEERDGKCRDSELPAHKVTLQDFYIGKYEVTNEEYCLFLNEKGNQKEGGVTWLNVESAYCEIEWHNEQFFPKIGFEEHPVVEVSWYGAIAYCKWLSEKTGERYKLPSEAQWEYAARGGLRSKDYQYAGSNSLGDVAWYGKNSSGRLHKTGDRNPNELAIHDMSGNVWEWCEDAWHSDYRGAPTDGSAWIATDYRVIRGGSWFDDHFDYCRVALRFDVLPYELGFNTGFRISRY